MSEMNAPGESRLLTNAEISAIKSIYRFAEPPTELAAMQVLTKGMRQADALRAYAPEDCSRQSLSSHVKRIRASFNDIILHYGPGTGTELTDERVAFLCKVNRFQLKATKIFIKFFKGECTYTEAASQMGVYCELCESRIKKLRQDHALLLSVFTSPKS